MRKHSENNRRFYIDAKRYVWFLLILWANRPQKRLYDRGKMVQNQDFRHRFIFCYISQFDESMEPRPGVIHISSKKV